MKYRRLIAVVIVVAAGILAGFYLANRSDNAAPQSNSNTPRVSSTRQSTANLDHIFVIAEENQPIGNVIGAADAPYLNSLAKRYALATNYFATTHPSLPNYLALTSGSTHGVTNDCIPTSADCVLNVPNIADLIEKSGRTWKEYAKGMPSSCYTSNAGNYAPRHNPFVYYTDILKNPARCETHVVPFNRLNIDLRSTQTTPNFAFITPDLCSDMHSCPVRTGDDWLSRHVPAILNSPAFTKQKSLLIITWDEGDRSANKVATIFAGTAAKRDFASARHYTHYSLLHTIEELWQLKPLTSNDASAPTMTDMLR